MDREKVIKGWECHMEADTLGCADCPYRQGWRTCNFADTLFKDVYSLLKEQETKWIHRADMDYKDKNGVVHFHGMCESCGFIHDFIDGHTGQYKFCPECGRSVKWE